MTAEEINLALADVLTNIAEGDREKIASKIILSVTQNLTNKTFLRGMSESLNAISDPDRHGKRWVQNFAGTAIPSVSAGVARAIDPTIREARDIVDYFKSRIPLVSKTLPAKKDIFGKPLERTGTVATRLISPVQVSKEKNNVVDTELQRLDIYLGMPGRRVGKTDIPPREYETLTTQAGQKLYKELHAMITADYYKKLSDINKEKLIRRKVSSIRKKERKPYREKYDQE